MWFSDGSFLYLSPFGSTSSPHFSKTIEDCSIISLVNAPKPIPYKKSMNLCLSIRPSFLAFNQKFINMSSDLNILTTLALRSAHSTLHAEMSVSRIIYMSSSSLPKSSKQLGKSFPSTIYKNNCDFSR